MFKHSFTLNALGIKKYSTLRIDPKPSKLSPWFVTGFTDAEGCFSISIYKDSTRPLGWRVCAEFLLGLHKKDVGLLKEIQEYLGGIGRIGKHYRSNAKNNSSFWQKPFNFSETCWLSSLKGNNFDDAPKGAYNSRRAFNYP